jgi:tRNA(Ile)-lysidine synthase
MRNYLFDFDGTLVDSMPTYVSSMLRILDENGVKYGDDIVKIITPLGLGGAADYYITLGIKMSREEILEYCTQNALDYVIDSTNAETDYTRNKIRAEIIPVLKGINGAVEKKAATSSLLLRRDEELLTSLADRFIETSRRSDGAIPIDSLNAEHPSVASRAIIKLYDEKIGASLEQVHVEDVLSLAKKAQAHSRLSLPAGYALIENGALYFLSESELRERTKTDSEDFCIPFADSAVFISQINAETVIGNTQRTKNIYKKSIQFSIDSAKINGELFLRPRIQGDRIFMGGMHKSVKKLMCDKKIPVEDRNRLPMICDADGIVAIPFIGVSDRSDPKKTKNKDIEKILDIQFYLY